MRPARGFVTLRGMGIRSQINSARRSAIIGAEEALRDEDAQTAGTASTRRAKLVQDKKDFMEGLRAGSEDCSDVDLNLKSNDDRAVVVIGGSSRVLLYGFLVSYPGVPLVPWGRPWLIAASLAAGFLSGLLLRGPSLRQVARFAGIAVLVFVTLWLGGAPSTSMVLVGAFFAGAVALASAYPFLYALVTAIAFVAGIVQLFDWSPFAMAQLPFSTRPFTSDRLSVEMLRFSGFMFLASMLRFSKWEIDRAKSKAEAAEAARDLAISDERARIARELHDVVSHHVTAMTLQAEAASLTGDRNALASVATAGREALTELRRMLGVLRHPSGGDDLGGTMEPQPGVEQLDRLADRTTAGLEVLIDRNGDVRPLPAGVELCIYRLVQEALTNSAKHGDATAVDVALTYGTDAVTVDIRDNGRPLGAPRVHSSGLGLIGMQERVTLLDGELSTGPRPDGTGYQVVARLPVAS